MLTCLVQLLQCAHMIMSSTAMDLSCTLGLESCVRGHLVSRGHRLFHAGHCSIFVWEVILQVINTLYKRGVASETRARLPCLHGFENNVIPVCQGEEYNCAITYSVTGNFQMVLFTKFKNHRRFLKRIF